MLSFDATGRGDLNHFILVVNLDKVIKDSFIVRAVLVVQFFNQIENVFHLRHVARGPNPELAAWILETLCLDVFHLVDSEVSLLPPL